MGRTKLIILTVVITFFYFPCLSQSRSRLLLYVQTEKTERKVSRLLNYQKEHKDSLSAVRELQKLLLSFREASYVMAGIDTLMRHGDTLIALFDPGETISWASLRKGNADDEILSKAGFKERFYQRRPFSYKEYFRLSEAFIKYSENHGNPFAGIGLDSITFDSSRHISAALNYDAGPHITFDSIEIAGKTKIKKKFLIAYLRIFPGQPFNQERVAAISGLLNQLSYVKQTRPYTIVFSNNKAILTLYLEDRRSNQADGIVGFLPNQSPGKKLLITGELNLRLKNLFGTGKSFSGEWKKFNQASQLLNLSYFHPKIFSANIDVKADFNLLKQDSTFLTLQRKITLYQKTGKAGTLSFSGGIKTSRQLSTQQMPAAQGVPAFSNFDYYQYGLGYDWYGLDDVFFPHRGFFLSAEASGGNKNIKKSSMYPDSVFKQMKINSVQINLHLLAEKYFALGKRSVVQAKVDAGKVMNNQGGLFYNDLYRIGGLRSLRGFNENFFYASGYAVGTLEYRFFTEESSYLLLFVDKAIVSNTLNPAVPVDYPTGFGAGVSFSTAAGVFNFVYSLGSSQTQKINFNLSKIHFGLISRF